MALDRMGNEILTRWARGGYSEADLAEAVRDGRPALDRLEPRPALDRLADGGADGGR